MSDIRALSAILTCSPGAPVFPSPNKTVAHGAARLPDLSSASVALGYATVWCARIHSSSTFGPFRILLDALPTVSSRRASPWSTPSTPSAASMKLASRGRRPLIRWSFSGVYLYLPEPPAKARAAAWRWRRKAGRSWLSPTPGYRANRRHRGAWRSPSWLRRAWGGVFRCR